MRFPQWLHTRRPVAAKPLPEPSEAVARHVGNQAYQLAKQIDSQDPIFQREVRLRLVRISRQVEEFSRHELSFAQTETWRTVYQSVLSSCQTKRYLSVALVEHEDYWQDPPGQASLEFNYELVHFGFYVHRRFVIDDFFWPPGAVYPDAEVFKHIQEQASRGIEVSLVRKSHLESESELICDFGIYGERAVGYQTLDEQGKTAAYLLRFGEAAVQAAEELWRQLDLYAISVDDLLDRPA
jgi:hypothetical protein